MSKNFELMQQAGENLHPHSGHELEMPSPHFGNGHRKADNLGVVRSASEEALRLVQRVFLLQAQPPHMVAFAGIDHQSGCSRVCIRVAETLAKNTHSSVCLVEANLRSPSLPEMFGTTNHLGLTNALLQDQPIRSFAKLVRGDNLWLVSSGELVPDPASLLNSERLKTRFAELRKEFDFVIIDAAPLTLYSDAIALGHMTDGFVLVLEANSTRREVALKVVEDFRAANVNVLGAVLNKRTFPIPNSLYTKL